MYQDFYGLKENPFSLSPDPQYLYLTTMHKEAITQLFYGVWERKGFMVLIGEVGMGKTLLLNWMLDKLAENDTPSSYIFNPVMTKTDMFEYISADFRLECNANSKSQFLMHLYNFLINLFARGKTAVLIVDEAQNLTFELLEELRMLSNLETGKHKLLQIILSGQPELNAKLNHLAMRQLKQRISLRCTLNPLSLDETKNYIYTRLVIAGMKGKTPFKNNIINQIYELSGGIPRIINNICDNALLAGYAYERKEIDHLVISQVVKDLQITSSNSETVPDPVFILTNPKSMTNLPDMKIYQAAKSSLSWPNLVAFISDLIRRFTTSIARKEGTN